MPTYDYRCPNGHDFERFFRKISDAEAESACPVCGAVAARRVSGGAGLVFKGSGFYLTDYGKNAHRKAGPESTSSDSKSESSGDSKPSTSSDGAKSDSGSTAGSKTEATAAPASKPDTAKKTDVKSSSKGERGDTT